MAKVLAMTLNQCFNDLPVDSPGTLVRDDCDIIMVHGARGDPDLGNHRTKGA